MECFSDLKEETINYNKQWLRFDSFTDEKIDDKHSFLEYRKIRRKNI